MFVEVTSDDPEGIYIYTEDGVFSMCTEYKIKTINTKGEIYDAR